LVDSAAQAARPEPQPRAEQFSHHRRARLLNRTGRRTNDAPSALIPDGRRGRKRKERIMPDYGGWMWLVIDVILVAVLAGGLVYGIMMWRRRHRDRVSQEVRDEATERLYHREDAR
jgi:hypothetical protein